MQHLKQLTDEQIVEFVRSTDQEAYLEIVLRYQDKLLRYANSLVQDDAKAADIVQNAFIKAFVNLHGFNTQKKFSSWIYRITHNEAINLFLKHVKEVPLSDDIDFESSENVQMDLVTAEMKQRVQRCLAQIPLIYSEPLILNFLEGHSYEEISDILRIPIGTVGTRINRAKKVMKHICQTTLR